MTQVSPEDRLIVSACRREPPDTTALGEWVDRCGAGGADRLIARLYAHRVPGLVLGVLNRLGLIRRFPPEAATLLETHLKRQTWRSALLALELQRLDRSFVDSGIHCVVLKGASLAPRVYGQAVERFMGDLDLLVRPDQVDAALAHLLARGYVNPWSKEAVRGYRTYHYHLPLTRPDGMILELHWDLVKPDRPYRLDPRGVIERSVALPAPATTMRMPSIEDQVLHTVVQQLQNGFTHLSRTVDLDRLVAVGRPDWEVLEERARACRLSHALAYGLQLARHLLGTNCPDGVVEALAPGPLARAHLSLFDPLQSALDQRFDERRAEYNLLRLWLTQTRASRVAILADLLRGMADHEPLKRPWTLADPQTPASGRPVVVELAKLGLSQAATYLRGLTRLRTSARFWSPPEKLPGA